jgi:hypothetical protein
MRARLLAGFAVVLALGCGSNKVVPVSGKVTMDGKPLKNATVSFQPIAEGKNIEAGPGSVGKTNDQGEYTLTTDKGDPGAVVGKHRVTIAIIAPEAGQDDKRRRGGPKLENKIPKRYGPGGKDELTFDVPAGGTTKADFPLKSR